MEKTMCMYCERKTDIKFGWDQPKLSYHNQVPEYNLGGNIADFDLFEGVIYDYQTSRPRITLTCNGYFDAKEGVRLWFRTKRPTYRQLCLKLVV